MPSFLPSSSNPLTLQAGNSGDASLSSSYSRRQQQQLRAAAEAVVASAPGSSVASSTSHSVHSMYQQQQQQQQQQRLHQDLDLSLDGSVGSSRRGVPLLRHGIARVVMTGGGGGNGVHQTIPIIVSDDVVSGTQRDGWMSPVRRFYCLLLTFDFLFTGLLWLITVIVTGTDIKTAIKQQILEYTIHDSMFDCVIAGALRFLISILFYAMLDVSHWAPVATTTAGTSIFLIAKVFEYQWTRFGTITFDVMLILLSFILAWGEVWFLDFRVLPLEMKAKELLGHFGNEGDETTPLLINAENAAERGMLQRYVEGSLWDGSVANFYSPMESPEDSSGEEVEEDTLVTVPRQFRRKLPLTPKEVEYRKLGEESLQTAWRLMNSPDWKLEKKVESTGDTVHSKIVRGKKLFRLTGIVDLPPKLLLEEMFYRIESIPMWNPTLTECKTIQPIDSHTDISYQVCAEAAKGVVSARDFVNLRYWQVLEDGTYFSAGVSTKHPAMPPQPKRTRGENGPGGWAMRPVAGDPHRCLFQWLLDTDLKGWIPQAIIDSALSGSQLEFIEYLRKYASTLHENGFVQDHLQQQASLLPKGAASLNLNS